ncbi:MAG TPA: glycosyltransferase [Bacillus bacterium]|nr:glycosyltransferase [Bacillus sp. (in: firmicutes)]
MRKLILKMIIISLAIGFAVPQVIVEAKEKVQTHHHCDWRAVAELKDDMRKLWIDHVVWTRDYLKSNLADLDDQEEVLARLLKNQKDLGKAIKPYYGEQTGNKFTTLLKEHIVIAGELIEAAKSGDSGKFNKINTKWYKNADDIVEFLSGANPKLDKKELKEAFYMHLKLVNDEVTARLNKDWEADILAFDQGEEHMIEFADTLARGIKNQFPEKFKCKE